MADDQIAPRRLSRARWFARIRVVATRTLLFIWTLSAIGLGLLLGWIFFAEPHKLGEAAFGNVSEWIAAVGTLVVGAGAWKIAYDAYTHQRDENLRNTRDRLTLKAARLRGMAIKTAAATTSADHYKKIKAGGFGPVSPYILKSALQSTVESKPTMVFTESELAVIDHVISPDFYRFEITKEAFEQRCSITSNYMSNSTTAPLPPNDVTSLDEVIKAAEDLERDANSLIDVLRSTRARIEERLRKMPSS